MSGAIAVELCKDYKGVQTAEGTLQIDLDPIAQIPGPVAMHKPLTMGGLNPLAFRLASVTVGLYSYDNAGRNPQCTVARNGAGYTYDPRPASCTGRYCKEASANLLSKLARKFDYSEADALCTCLAKKQNLPSIAFGGGTDIPGVLLTGLGTFIPPAMPALISLSPLLALFKVTADFTFTWQPYSCGGLLRRDMNLDLALAISIPPVPMAFDFFNPEWSTLEHYSKGVVGSHEQVPDVGASITGAFKKLETMLQQNLIPWNAVSGPFLRARLAHCWLLLPYPPPPLPPPPPRSRTSAPNTRTRQRRTLRRTRASLWALPATPPWRACAPCSSRRRCAWTSSSSRTTRARGGRRPFKCAGPTACPATAAAAAKKCLGSACFGTPPTARRTGPAG